MRAHQRTLASAVEVTGRGLHTGEPVRVRLRPARAGTGALLLRGDLPDADPIPVSPASLVAGQRRTVLARGPAEVHTVEHLFAALHVLGVDNVEIELDAPEMPALDGSALPWFEAIGRAGVTELRESRRVLVLERPLLVEHEGATLAAYPGPQGRLHLSYLLDYRHHGLPPQFVDIELPGGDARSELAPARTFVFRSEVESLRSQGLGRGADASNTVVLGGPDQQLRFPDEPARHKLVDLLGDLYLVGADVVGRIVATKSGHAAHHELVRRLVAEKERLENAGRATRDSGLGIREITQILPHRYPFLLVDRVLELEGYRRAVGIKNVTMNEPFFAGHFPDQPIMPGVLILEALAQLAGTLLLRRLEFTGKLPVLWSIDKVKLRRSVVPGDQLRLEVEATKVRDTMGRCECVAKVDEHVAAEAHMVFTLVDAG